MPTTRNKGFDPFPTRFRFHSAAARWSEACWANPSSVATSAAGRSWRELPLKFVHAVSMRSRKAEALIHSTLVIAWEILMGRVNVFLTGKLLDELDTEATKQKSNGSDL